MSLKNEIEIIWLENPDKFAYLRETWVRTSTPRRISKKVLGKDKRLIGYAVHRADGSRSYMRRVWYLSPWDFEEGVYCNVEDESLKSCPCEAVINNRIQVGKPSESYSDYLAGTIEMRKWRRQEESMAEHADGIAGD